MSTVSDIVSNCVERLLFRPLTVVSVESIGERFRLLRMEGKALETFDGLHARPLKSFLETHQAHLYGLDLDTDAGSACFLFYLHGDGPGSRRLPP